MYIDVASLFCIINIFTTLHLGPLYIACKAYTWDIHDVSLKNIGMRACGLRQFLFDGLCVNFFLAVSLSENIQDPFR